MTAKALKILVASDQAFPDLQPGDCFVVTELQRPGYGAAPYVGIELHDAYPQGLPAGPYNEAHAGSPADLARAVQLQQRQDGRDVFCVVDLDRFGDTGFTVVQSPSRVLASYDLGPPITLDLVGEKMREIRRAHGVKWFWVDGEIDACRFLARFYGLPVRRVTGLV